MVRQKRTADSASDGASPGPPKRTAHNLTKRFVDDLEPSSDPFGRRYYDDDLRGFGVAVFPSGRKTFFVEYGERGRMRRMKIGRFGQLTVAEARDIARKRLADYLRGEDPLDARQARRKETEFGAWADDYLDLVRPRKKHVRDDVRYLGEAKERWRTRPLGTLTAEEIERAFQDKRKAVSAVTANRFLASIRACLQEAWRKGLIEQNPAMKIRALPENPPRERTLRDDELSRVLRAIEGLTSAYARAGLLLLVQTGARLSEVVNAKWEDVDLDSGTWRIPSPKAGRPQYVPLPAEIVEMLRKLPRAGCYVVAGRSENRPRHDLRRAWDSVIEEAGVEGVHIHDLRRTFGLHITRSAGLHMASKLLRHSDVRVTERHYAPLGFEELRGVLDRRARNIEEIRRLEPEGGDGGGEPDRAKPPKRRKARKAK